MATTPTAPANLQSDASPPAASRNWLIIGQIGVLLALWPILKSIPGLPYGGQVYMFVTMVAATWFIRRDGQTWRDLGLRWASNRRDLAKGAGMVVAVFVASVAMNGLVQWVFASVLGLSIERTLPDVSTLAAYLIIMGLIWTTNAFGEEMVFRAFMMSRISELLGGSRFAWILAAIVQATIFGLGHAYQGTMGIVITGMVGLVFGLGYLLSRRNLWPVIIAHGIINSVGMTFLHLQATGAIPAS